MKRISKYYSIRITVLIFLSTYLVIEVTGQQPTVSPDFHSYYYSPQNLGISTPQVTDFIKYGNLSANQYNGLINLEIPIGGYDDKDFDLSISLKYISNGFIPAKRPSFVGNNWVLSYGGVITRSVYGSPDDNRGKYVNSGNKEYIVDGILVPIRNNTFVQYSETDLTYFNMAENSGGNNTPYVRGDFKHDFEPDIFRFSFGQHSGSFIIGNQGIPFSSCGPGYKIDISGIAIQAYSTTSAPANSSITITTPDGYIYTFGGSTNYLEYCIPSNSNNAVKVVPRFITAWYLKSIKTPKGREVAFTYSSVLQKNKYNSFIYAYNEFFVRNIGNLNCNVTHPYSTSLTAKNLIMTDNIYTPVINKIAIDNGMEIEFNIQLNSVGFYENDDYSLYLSSIKYKHNSNIVKNISFSYKYSGKYFFLDSILMNDKVYKFDYNLSTTLPNPLTISTDHWGFWAGGYNTSFAENDQTGAANYCFNIDANKQVNTNVCNVSLLNKITYPTGGTTEIFYEYNRYRKYLTRSMNNVSLVMDSVIESVPCGGARVQKIRDYDPISQRYSNEKTFTYKNPQMNKESGIVGVLPKYKTQEKITTVEFDGIWVNNQYISCNYLVENTVTDISSNSYSSNDILEEYHIGYSDVIEKFNDNSYIASHFSSLSDIPDGEDVTYKAVLMGASTTMGTIAQIEKTGLYKTNDMSLFRGKLLEEKTYDNSGNLVLQKYNKYNTTSAKSKYNISVRSVPRGCSSYKIYLTPCLIEQQQTIDKNNVVSIEKYKYDEYYRNFFTSTYANNNDSLVVEKYYPNNNSKLYEKNIIVNPIEEVTKKNNVEIKRIKTIYENTSILPSSVQVAYGGALQTEETYNRYDNKGNILQLTGKDNIPIIYLWSYKQYFPIGEIKNAMYSEVQSAVNNVFSMTIEALSSQTIPNETALKNGSLQNALPNSLVTTYTHNPLVGVSSITNPRGITTYFEYDIFGRLQRKKLLGDVLQEFDYHYK